VRRWLPDPRGAPAPVAPVSMPRTKRKEPTPKGSDAEPKAAPKKKAKGATQDGSGRQCIPIYKVKSFHGDLEENVNETLQWNGKKGPLGSFGVGSGEHAINSVHVAHGEKCSVTFVSKDKHGLGRHWTCVCQQGKHIPGLLFDIEASGNVRCRDSRPEGQPEVRGSVYRAQKSAPDVYPFMNIYQSKLDEFFRNEGRRGQLYRQNVLKKMSTPVETSNVESFRIGIYEYMSSLSLCSIMISKHVLDKWAKDKKTLDELVGRIGEFENKHSKSDEERLSFAVHKRSPEMSLSILEFMQKYPLNVDVMNEVDEIFDVKVMQASGRPALSGPSGASMTTSYKTVPPDGSKGVIEDVDFKCSVQCCTVRDNIERASAMKIYMKDNPSATEEEFDQRRATDPTVSKHIQCGQKRERCWYRLFTTKNIPASWLYAFILRYITVTDMRNEYKELFPEKEVKLVDIIKKENHVDKLIKIMNSLIAKATINGATIHRTPDIIPKPLSKMEIRPRHAIHQNRHAYYIFLMKDAVQRWILNCANEVYPVRPEVDDGDKNAVVYVPTHILRTEHPSAETYTFDKEPDQNSKYYDIRKRTYSDFASKWNFHLGEDGELNIVDQTTDDASALFNAPEEFKDVIPSLVIILQLKFFWLALPENYFELSNEKTNEQSSFFKKKGDILQVPVMDGWSKLAIILRMNDDVGLFRGARKIGNVVATTGTTASVSKMGSLPFVNGYYTEYRLDGTVRRKSETAVLKVMETQDDTGAVQDGEYFAVGVGERDYTFWDFATKLTTATNFPLVPLYLTVALMQLGGKENIPAACNAIKFNPEARVEVRGCLVLNPKFKELFRSLTGIDIKPIMCKDHQKSVVRGFRSDTVGHTFLATNLAVYGKTIVLHSSISDTSESKTKQVVSFSSEEGKLYIGDQMPSTIPLETTLEAPMPSQFVEDRIPETQASYELKEKIKLYFGTMDGSVYKPEELKNTAFLDNRLMAILSTSAWNSDSEVLLIRRGHYICCPTERVHGPGFKYGKPCSAQPAPHAEDGGFGKGKGKGWRNPEYNAYKKFCGAEKADNLPSLPFLVPNVSHKLRKLCMGNPRLRFPMRDNFKERTRGPSKDRKRKHPDDAQPKVIKQVEVLTQDVEYDSGGASDDDVEDTAFDEE